MGAIWETFTHCAASWTVFIFYSITLLTLITMAGITYFVTLYFTSLLGTKEWLVFTCLAWRAVCCMQREGLVYVLIAFVHCCMGGVSLRLLYCVSGEALVLSPAMLYAYTALAYLYLFRLIRGGCISTLRIYP